MHEFFRIKKGGETMRKGEAYERKGMKEKAKNAIIRFKNLILPGKMSKKIRRSQKTRRVIE